VAIDIDEIIECRYWYGVWWSFGLSKKFNNNNWRTSQKEVSRICCQKIMALDVDTRLVLRTLRSNHFE